MMLEFLTDLPGLSAALQRFMAEKSASLPDATREALIEHASSSSPVDRVVSAAEILYAARAELDRDGLAMAAQLAQFAGMNGWHQMGSRGFAMAAALQRGGGFRAAPGTSWPDPETDPAPLERFLP